MAATNMTKLVELTHLEIVNLVRCTGPKRYEHMDDPRIKPYGRYVGGFVDDWQWDTAALYAADLDTLWALYQYMKINF
jgi:hypothetical protein